MKKTIIAALLLALFAAPTLAAPPTGAKDKYFYYEYAKLVHECYEYIYDDNFSWTVPSGKVWFATNLWNTKVNSSTKSVYHRPLHVKDAEVLPAGTVVSTSGSAAFALIAKPENCESDLPTSDYEEAYYQKLWDIYALPIVTATVSIPSGNSYTYYGGVNFANTTQEDFDKGYIHHITTQDAAWTILVGDQAAGLPAGNFDSVNTLNEISDRHQDRRGENVLLPFFHGESFAPPLFKINGAWCHGASVSGNSTETGIAGHCVVQYKKVP